MQVMKNCSFKDLSWHGRLSLVEIIGKSQDGIVRTASFNNSRNRLRSRPPDVGDQSRFEISRDERQRIVVIQPKDFASTQKQHRACFYKPRDVGQRHCQPVELLEFCLCPHAKLTRPRIAVATPAGGRAGRFQKRSCLPVQLSKPVRAPRSFCTARKRP